MKFYHGEIQLEVPENVYYPREDSILMAKALENLEIKGKSVLEVGCGSGFLSIIAAKNGAHVTAVDINAEAVKTAKANAEANGCNIETIQSDLFSSVKGKFDLIIFNPPYLPVEAGENDPTYAGGKSGREVIERFINMTNGHLKPNGRVLIVISSLTGKKEIIELLKKTGMTVSIIAREKIPWEELIVIEASQS